MANLYTFSDNDLLNMQCNVILSIEIPIKYRAFIKADVLAGPFSVSRDHTEKIKNINIESGVGLSITFPTLSTPALGGVKDKYFSTDGYTLWIETFNVALSLLDHIRTEGNVISLGISTKGGIPEIYLDEANVNKYPRPLSAGSLVGDAESVGTVGEKIKNLGVAVLAKDSPTKPILPIMIGTAFFPAFTKNGNDIAVTTLVAGKGYPLFNNAASLTVPDSHLILKDIQIAGAMPLIGVMSSDPTTQNPYIKIGILGGLLCNHNGPTEFSLPTTGKNIVTNSLTLLTKEDLIGLGHFSKGALERVLTGSVHIGTLSISTSMKCTKIKCYNELYKPNTVDAVNKGEDIIVTPDELNHNDYSINLSSKNIPWCYKDYGKATAAVDITRAPWSIIFELELTDTAGLKKITISADSKDVTTITVDKMRESVPYNKTLNEF